ncbi:hypothetical protein BHE74_00053823 [Ensete ventricosum]|nr:hypothetical protein BHE74_00053823 [Ensete ventricosum]
MVLSRTLQLKKECERKTRGYGEGEEEDELKGELVEFLEKEVAEDDEGRPRERERCRARADRGQDVAVRRAKAHRGGRRRRRRRLHRFGSPDLARSPREGEEVRGNDR